MRKFVLLLFAFGMTTYLFGQIPQIQNGGGTLKEVGSKLVIGNSRTGAGGEGKRLMVMGQDLMFIGGDAAFGQEVYMYRGSTGTEELLLDINPGAASSNPNNFVKALDGRIYFAAKTEDAGNELWVTDGTTAGTKMVMDLNPTPAEGSDPSVMAAFKNGIIYAAKDAIAAAEGRSALFYSDGKTITVLKRGITIQNSGESRNRYMQTSPNGLKAFFVADDGTHGKELWFSDGTPEGTHMVLDIGFFKRDDDPSKTIDTRYEHQLMVNNEQCVFRAYTPAWWVGLDGKYKWINNECWVSDGTALGTYCLGDYFKSTDPGDATRTGHSTANYFQICDGKVLMRITNEKGCDLGGTNLIPELFDDKGVSIPGTGIQMLAKGNGPDANGNPGNSWFQCADTWDSLYVSSLNYEVGVSPDINNVDATGKQVVAGRELVIYDPRKDTLFLVADYYGPTDGLCVNNDGNPWPAHANRRLYFPGRAEAGSADDNMFYIEALADDPSHKPKVLFSGEGSVTVYYHINYNEKLAVVTRSAGNEAGQPDIVHLYIYDDGLDKTHAITANGDARDIPVYKGPGSINRGLPTAILKNSMINDIKIFPNPAKKSVIISMAQDRAEMKIFSINGQMVWDGVMFNNRSLDVSNLKAGLYVLKIKTDKGITSAKLEIAQ
jgi:ELWxxDGT repeat protein